MSVWTEENSLAKRFWDSPSAPVPVYDMHGHMGTHNAIYMARCESEAMVAHLKKAGVKRLVLSHHHTLNDPQAFSNSQVYSICAKHPEILRMYVGVNPHYPAEIERDIAEFDSKRGLETGFKLLSAYHRVPVDDARYAPVFEFADSRGLVMLFHTWGGDPCSEPGMMARLAQKYRNVKFFMGHSFRSDWSGIASIARSCPDNVFFELTSIPGCAGMIKKYVSVVGSERMIYGTDMPWFDEYQHIGGIVSADISDDAKENILHRNVERLLGDDF